MEAKLDIHEMVQVCILHLKELYRIYHLHHQLQRLFRERENCLIISQRIALNTSFQ